MTQPLLPIAVILVLLCTTLIGLVIFNQNMLRAERRRSAERAEVDRRLIEALETNAAAQKRRGDVFEDLAEVRQGTIEILKERLGLVEASPHPLQ